MNVLFASSEIFPYAKSGGLADVAYSLPEDLRTKATVYTIMPLYKIVNRDKYSIEYQGTSFDIWLGGVRHQIDVFSKKDNKFELFLYNPILCDRDGMYHDSFGDFGDNALRFGLFSYAIIETMLQLKLNCDAIHINDWQTALVALLAKTKYFLTQKIIFTIHNIAYQGIFDKTTVSELELSWNECFKNDRLEYFDSVNFLKAGIFYSDKVTTVSPSYAKEIQTTAFGHTLEDTLVVNNYKLEGILNGLGYDVFDPQNDTYITQNYDAKSYELKAKNKVKLLKELGLEGAEKPLFVFIGRFTEQKGVNLIIESLHLLKDLDINFVILGSGEKYYNHIFENLAGKYSNIHITVGFDEAYSRRLYASCDFLLMPSKFEPCGLNQMITMRYGALPIVAYTGGLKDSVIDFTHTDDYSKKVGIGVVYKEHTIFWYMYAITKAISLYANKSRFVKLAKHNMNVDNSWKNSSKEYLKLYR
ncbi:MAG: glycogen/starch synthase [Arcobacteraceae bacterium]|nr:glycogen/starch synthase [Arcobacteraceae bacterium]